LKDPMDGSFPEDSPHRDHARAVLRKRLLQGLAAGTLTQDMVARGELAGALTRADLAVQAVRLADDVHHLLGQVVDTGCGYVKPCPDGALTLPVTPAVADRMRQLRVLTGSPPDTGPGPLLLRRAFEISESEADAVRGPPLDAMTIEHHLRALCRVHSTWGWHHFLATEFDGSKRVLATIRFLLLNRLLPRATVLAMEQAVTEVTVQGLGVNMGSAHMRAVLTATRIALGDSLAVAERVAQDTDLRRDAALGRRHLLAKDSYYYVAPPDDMTWRSTASVALLKHGAEADAHAQAAKDRARRERVARVAAYEQEVRAQRAAAAMRDVGKKWSGKLGAGYANASVKRARGEGTDRHDPPRS